MSGLCEFSGVNMDDLILSCVLTGRGLDESLFWDWDETEVISTSVILCWRGHSR